MVVHNSCSCISFSIIVSCIFISLLLVTVGIMYDRAGSTINVIILLDGENISFDANLVVYVCMYVCMYVCVCVCVCVCVYIYIYI